MSAMDCEEAALLITALVDGELAVDDVSRIEAHLAGCDDCAQRRRLEERLKAFLRSRASALRTPDGLEAHVRSALSGMDAGGAARSAAARPSDTLAARARQRWLPLSVVGFAIVAMTAMFISLEVKKAGRSASPLLETLATVHYAATQAGILQVRTQDPPELAVWLEDRLGRPVTVPALDHIGLTPAGGRVMELEGRRVPMVLYRDYGEGAPDLTVIAAGTDFPWSSTGWSPAVLGDIGLHQASYRGQDMALFIHRGALWVLVSSRGETGMREVAGAMVAALEAGPGTLAPAGPIR